MALDLTGYAAPEQQWRGLYALSDSMQQERRYDQLQKREDAARKKAGQSMLSGYLDEKDFLTGTNYDPYFVEKLGGLIEEGNALLNTEGMDGNMAMAALAPRFNKLLQEKAVVKGLKSQLDQYIPLIKGKKGIDAAKVADYFKDVAYYTTDENGNRVLRDISQIDLSKNYVDEVLRTRPVYTPESISDWIKNTGTVTTEEDVMVGDSRRGYKRNKLQITGSPFFQPEIGQSGGFEGEFVPKYEIAKDGDKELMGVFGKTKAPIRVVSQETFANAPDEAKAYAVQLARQDAEMAGGITNPEGFGLLVRAKMYDVMKQYPNKAGYKSVEATKPPQVSISVAPTPTEPSYKDAYNATVDVINSEEHTGRGVWIPYNKVPQTMQPILVNMAKQYNSQLQGQNLYVIKKGKGLALAAVVSSQDPTTLEAKNDVIIIGDLDPTQSNITASKEFGQKSAVVAGEKTQAKQVAAKPNKAKAKDDDFSEFLRK